MNFDSLQHPPKCQKTLLLIGTDFWTTFDNHGGLEVAEVDVLIFLSIHITHSIALQGLEVEVTMMEPK